MPRFVSGRLLVKFRSDVSASKIRSLIAAARSRTVEQLPRIGVHVLDLPAQANEEAMARVFRGWKEVEFAEPDYIFAPEDVIPNDPWYANQWQLRKIAAPIAWSTTTGSDSVIIAILDTGVDGTHEDLAAKMVPGWNFYDNNADTSDLNGHGTAVGGTAAECSNNGIGVASVAWGCKIMPIRVSDPKGYGYISAMAKGLTWAADNHARVANISYKVTNSSTVTEAAKYFQSKGGVVTVAAGNDGTFDPTPDNPYVLTVSATNGNDELYSWSNTGNNLDLVAPGSSYSAVNGGGYSTAFGTSFSAPTVAGVAALVISVSPNLTASQIQGILKQSADDLGDSSWDTKYGWGRVNAAKAVALALSTGGNTDATPPTVNFSAPPDGATVSGTVSVQVTASDDVGVESVSLSVEGTLLGTDTASPYTFSWDTTQVTNGSHTLKATAKDMAGNTATAQITVSVSNATPSNSGDNTPPTISIISPADGTTVGSKVVSVLVNATDNVAVSKVELYVDGKLTNTSTTAPFTTKWNTRKASSGPHKLWTKAYDAAGNTATVTETVYKQ